MQLLVNHFMCSETEPSWTSTAYVDKLPEAETST